MNFTKNSKGITLVALVITIIVLLILAAVSLNLVAGGDGILGRATKAVDATNLAKSYEEIELAMAEEKAKFYDKKYVERDPEVTKFKDFGEYIADKLSKKDETTGKVVGIKTPSGGKVTLEDDKIYFTEEGKNTPTVTGTLNEDGTITNLESSSDGSSEGGTQNPEPTKYTVTYNANSGSGSVPANAEYAENATVTVNFTTVPTKDGYKFLGWAENASATTATYTSAGTTNFIMGTANVTLYAVWKQTFAGKIDTANYGDYVDLGTEILPTTDGVITQKLGGAEPTEQPLTDWRIFHEDKNGVYLILSDYLLYDETLGTGLTQYDSTYPYNWRSTISRIDLIDRLNAKVSVLPEGNPWNKLINSKYTAKGINVKGALDLETWVASWNAKGYTKLFTNTFSNENGSVQYDGLDGYYIGTTENPTTEYQSVSSDTAGYGNTLYFPHTKNLSYSLGYWLASPCAYASNFVMYVYYSGGVGDLYYSYDYSGFSVRPAVFVPSGITAEKVDGIWELDI